MSQQDNRGTTPLAFLLGRTGTLANQRFAIESERVAIGRDASQCQIVLDQPIVSKRHALIEMSGQQATIIDLGSRNGTFVNGEQVARRDLRDGDVIGFGPGGAIAFSFHKAGPQAAGQGTQGPRPIIDNQSNLPQQPVAQIASDQRASMRAPTASGPQSVA